MKEILYYSETYKIIGALAILMAFFYTLGNYTKRRFVAIGVVDEDDNLGSVDSSLLGLFAFFLGFTFGMAGDKHDNRQQAVIAEANAIGTVIDYADLYSDTIRADYRRDLSEYLEARISYFKEGPDDLVNRRFLDQTNEIYNRMWRKTVKYAKQPEFVETNRLMIPAMDAMSDAVTTRDAANESKIPISIYVVLGVLSLISSFIVGFGIQGRAYTNIIGYLFVVMVSLSIYLIIDLDSSRTGLITSRESNEKIIELKESLNKQSR